MILLHQSAGATSLNKRFVMADRMPRFLMPGEEIEFVYDATILRHRLRNRDRWFDNFDVFSDCYGVSLHETTANGTIGTSTWKSGDNNTMNPQGVRKLSTGTTANGGVTIGDFATKNRGGRGCAFFLARLAIETAVTVGDKFALRAGFHDSTASADPSNGVYWEYLWDSASSSPTWQMVTSTGGSQTRLYPAASLGGANTYHFFGVFLNGDWTKAWFLHSLDTENWKIEGSINANMPIPNRSFGFGVQMLKSLGTTVANAHVDLIGKTYWALRGQ